MKLVEEFLCMFFSVSGYIVPPPEEKIKIYDRIVTGFDEIVIFQ